MIRRFVAHEAVIARWLIVLLLFLLLRSQKEMIPMIYDLNGLRVETRDGIENVGSHLEEIDWLLRNRQ